MLKKIIKDFPDVIPLLNDYKKLQSKVKSLSRRLKTVQTKYNFLETIVGEGIDDIKLCSSVKLLLKNAGFEKVVHYSSERIRPKREDLLAYSDNDLIVIEVKGLSTAHPTHSDLMQVTKYIAETKKRQPRMKVTGISIINHDKKNKVQLRHQNFNDAERQNDALNLNYGFISTIDLVIGFWKLKMKEITFEEFKTRLQETGFITFDSKGGKTRRQIGL